jgi:hypothetical protein
VRPHAGGVALCGQQRVQARDAHEPAFLELREQTVGLADRVGIAGHALGAAVLPLGHQPGALEHGDVLLHRGEGHLVARGQLADGRVGVHHTSQDVAPRGVGERAEQLVEVVRRGLTIYNHLVVDASTDREWLC